MGGSIRWHQAILWVTAVAARYINIGDRTDGFYSSAFVRTQDGQLINDAGGRPIVNPVSQFLGYVNPKFVWGINNRFSYKNLTFSFQFDGRVGGVIGDYVRQKTFQGGRHIETVQGAYGAAVLTMCWVLSLIWAMA